MLKIIYCAMAGYVAFSLAVGIIKGKCLRDQLSSCIVLIPLFMRAFLIR